MKALQKITSNGSNKTLKTKKEKTMKTMKPFLYVVMSSIILMTMLFVGNADAAWPQITSPTPNSTLSGSSVTFRWSNNGTVVNQYWLYVGTGVGKYDIYNSNSTLTNDTTSRTVSGLPTNGSKVYVRFYFRTDRWWYWDYTYTAYRQSNTSSNASCPCFTTAELDSQYDQLVTGNGLTVDSCIESDNSNNVGGGYPEYTEYVLAACAGGNCDLSPDFSVGVSSGFPYDGTSRHHWNAGCFLVDERLNPAKHLQFDSNLTRVEVEACSNTIKNSKWIQNGVCQ